MNCIQSGQEGQTFPRCAAGCTALAGLFLLMGAVAAAGDGPPLTDRAVDDAVRRGVAWLKSVRKADGHWDELPPGDAKYLGGDTALALLALLYAGEDPRQSDLSKPLQWLATQRLEATYVYGTRAHVLALIPGSKYRSRLEGDLNWLTSSIWKRNGQDPGSYGYIAPEPRHDSGYYDNSNSQFAVLGAWMAAEAGVKVPDDYWSLVEQHWMRDQLPDGGWGYVKDRSTGSMTAAGLATLYVLLDQVHARDEGRFNGTSTANCGRYKGAGEVIRAIEGGLNWLGREFAPNNPRGGEEWKFYYLYGVERAGRASGRKYFRDRDWFRTGAAELLASQQSDGRWQGSGGLMSDLRNTCFAVMFLCHGRAPLLFNKLEYGSDSQNKLRDVAGLTRYAQNSFERLLNWQIVSLDGTMDDLLEAPVLYMSGHNAWKFSDVEVQKLREYCLRGGQILGVACCSKDEFRVGFGSLASRAFPEYAPRELPKDHPIFSGEVQYAIKDPPQMLEVSNGLRTLMLLSTHDICTAWNQYLVKDYESHLQLGCNIYLYATDKTTFSSRLQTAEILQRPIEAQRTIRVARLRYDGPWDIEPYGWTRLARHMNNETASRLLVTSGVALDSPELEQFKVAYLTGTRAFELNANELNGLRRFLTGGGTLLADAATGSEAFLQSFETQVGGVLKSQASVLGADSLVITGEGLPRGTSLRTVGYRRASRAENAGQSHPQLKAFELGKRLAVIYAPLDISSSLLGTPIYNCHGYDAESALRIARNMLLYAQLSSDEKARLSQSR